MFKWIFLSEFFHIDISNCRLHTFLKTEVMLKVQFGGLELFKNKGALFQDEFYLPRFFRPPLTNWWYIVQILMDGLALCVFFKAFVCWWNLTTWAASVAILLSLPNSTYFATYGWELSCTCIVMNHNVWFAYSSRAPALERHDWDVYNQNMVMLLIF